MWRDWLSGSQITQTCMTCNLLDPSWTSFYFPYPAVPKPLRAKLLIVFIFSRLFFSMLYRTCLASLRNETELRLSHRIITVWALRYVLPLPPFFPVWSPTKRHQFEVIFELFFIFELFSLSFRLPFLTNAMKKRALKQRVNANVLVQVLSISLNHHCDTREGT